jgi:transglutaminase-like putative cysteine protease
MRRRISLATGVVTSLLALMCPSAVAAIPPWMQQAAASQAGTYAADTNAVVLFEETTYTVSNANEYVEHYRRVVRILRPDGRTEGRLWVYLEGGAKLLSVHAWSLDSAAREYELKEKDFIEQSAAAGFELYADVRVRTALAPAAQAGSLIGFEYEVRRPVWLNQLDWEFQEDIPLRQARLIVELPAGWEYKTSWAAAQPVEPTKIGENSWQWELHDVPGIEDEPKSPAFRALEGRMDVAFFSPADNTINFASWQGLGNWINKLGADRRTVSPEMAAKVHELIAGKTDFDAKLRALTSFLQTEVRYVAIEIGIGGYQPHAASEVFRARYGDCKDKATLLGAMLQEAGISSSYVGIHTERGVADPAVPSVYSFNHAIIAIELPPGTAPETYHSVVTSKSGKRYLIFDPTDPYTPVGDLRSELQDTYALLVTADGGELIRTPIQKPATNQLVRTGTFTLGPDGTLAGEVVEDRSGDHASDLRGQLRYSTELQRKQRMERFLNRSLKGFTLESSDIEQLDQIHKDLIVKYKFSTPQYAQVMGTMMLVRPRVVGEKSFAVERKPRLYPVELEGSSRETDTYEIELPPQYKVDDVPEPVKLDMGFASYQSKVEVEGQKIRYSRELVVRDVSVPADRIADLRKFENAVGGDEMAAVVLKRAQ